MRIIAIFSFDSLLWARGLKPDHPKQETEMMLTIPPR